jgi:hypothetical protein
VGDYGRRERRRKEKEERDKGQYSYLMFNLKGK